MATSRYIEDLNGLGSITLFEPPDVFPVTVDRIFHADPAVISADASTVALAAPFAAYLYWGMLAAAREKEGESQLLDVAAHARERMAEFEAVAKAYYGATP